jgi:soluble P-type ATPase
VAQLNAMGVRSVMLTGDNRRTAQAIAGKLGIEWEAELLPQDKLRLVNEMKRDAKVAMVGDGINDAPALATADVGIAMGGGTDVALETADAALLKSRVTDVAHLVALSRATMANIHQNVVFAIGLKGLFLVTTVLGITGLWVAVLADTGATALVTLNALRRCASRARRRPTTATTPGVPLPCPCRLPAEATRGLDLASRCLASTQMSAERRKGRSPASKKGSLPCVKIRIIVVAGVIAAVGDSDRCPRRQGRGQGRGAGGRADAAGARGRGHYPHGRRDKGYAQRRRSPSLRTENRMRIGELARLTAPRRTFGSTSGRACCKPRSGHATTIGAMARPMSNGFT